MEESPAWLALQRQALAFLLALWPVLVLMRVLKVAVKGEVKREVKVKKKTGWLAPFELCRVILRQHSPK